MAACTDPLHRHQGDHAHKGAGDKRDPIVDHPQKSSDTWEDHRRDMVDGKADRHAGRDIPRVTHFLKIGTYRNRKIKKDMIQDVKD